MAEGSTSQHDDVLQTQYNIEEIAQFNKELDGKTPQEILVWAIDHLDGLFQTTAFGLYVFLSVHRKIYDSGTWH